MRAVGRWRQLQQRGSVAAFADYVYKLQALCPMSQNAEFKLVFYALREELQGEVQRHLRQYGVDSLPLDTLFQVASDAELSCGMKSKAEAGEKRQKEGGRIRRTSKQEGGTASRPIEVGQMVSTSTQRPFRGGNNSSKLLENF